MLKELLKSTELQPEDTNKMAFLKGVVEGALEGFVIIGAVFTLTNLFTNDKK